MRRTMLLLAFFALPLGAQETKFEEKVDVNLVLVDVTVTDSKGNQILGLTKDDFIVKEDGVAQALDSVDYFTNRRLLTDPESKAAFKVERVRDERYFVLFFDKLTDTSFYPDFFSELMKAKQASLEFVQNELLENDRVAIVGFDTRLKVYSDFTSDKKQLERALNDAVKFSNGITKTDSPTILKDLTRKQMDKPRNTYEAIKILAGTLQPIQARKVVVLFSPGIAENITSTGFSQDETWYQPMIHALNKANITVYPISLLRGVFHHPVFDSLSRMASDTGGDFYRDVVNYRMPLQKVENVNNGYYMVTYYARKPAAKDGYQRVQVSIKNPEFRVKARDGYPY